MNLIHHYINGKVVSGDSKRKGKVFNPATGNQDSEVLLGTKSDFEPNITSDSWSPVAGLNTFPFLSDFPGTIFPFTKC